MERPDKEANPSPRVGRLLKDPEDPLKSGKKTSLRATRPFTNSPLLGGKELTRLRLLLKAKTGKRKSGRIRLKGSIRRSML